MKPTLDRGRSIGSTSSFQIDAESYPGREASQNTRNYNGCCRTHRKRSLVCVDDSHTQVKDLQLVRLAQ